MTAVYCVIALVLLLLSHFLSNFFTRGLHAIPGPAIAKFTNLWRLIETWKGHYEHVIQDLHRQHGNIVRVGPNIVSITDPDAIESIHGINAGFPKVSAAILGSRCQIIPLVFS